MNIHGVFMLFFMLYILGGSQVLHIKNIRTIRLVKFPVVIPL